MATICNTILKVSSQEIHGCMKDFTFERYQHMCITQRKKARNLSHEKINK